MGFYPGSVPKTRLRFFLLLFYLVYFFFSHWLPRIANGDSLCTIVRAPAILFGQAL